MRAAAVLLAAGCSSFEPSSIPAHADTKSTILIAGDEGFALDANREPAVSVARTDPPAPLLALLYPWTLDELQLAPGRIEGRGRALLPALHAYASSSDRTDWSATDASAMIDFELPSFDFARCATGGRCSSDGFVCTACAIAPRDEMIAPPLVNEPCPADRFAGEPAGYDAVVYVAPGASGVGTRDDPVGTIGGALTGTTGRLAIMLSKGTHVAPATLAREAAIFGACAAETILEGATVELSTDHVSGVHLSRALIHATSEVTIDRVVADALTISTMGPIATASNVQALELYLEVESDASLSLERVSCVSLQLDLGSAVPIDVRDVAVEGLIHLRCKSGAVCAAQSSMQRIRGALLIARFPIAIGDVLVSTGALTGVTVEGGSVVSIDRFLIEDAREIGASSDAASTLVLSDGVIRNTNVGVSGEISVRNVRFEEVVTPFAR